MFRRFTGVRPLAVGALFCCLSACSPNGPYVPLPETGATISGTVTYKKQLVTAGMVILEGNGTGSATKIGADGRYTITNAPLGEVKVAVNTAMARAMVMGPAQAQANAPGSAKSAKAVTTPKIVEVPGNYADPNKSPLRTTIKSGDNTFDITID